MHQVKVINSNPFEIVDYFDGIAYKFTPKKGVNLDLEAAKHIFGVDFPDTKEGCEDDSFRASVFRFLQRRWGWNSTKEEAIMDARRKFAKLEFVPVEIKMVELVAQVDEPAEPRAPKESPKKADFKPRADAVKVEPEDEAEIA